MRYLKPELLSAELAIEAIRGGKDFMWDPESDGSNYLTPSAYEVDE